MAVRMLLQGLCSQLKMCLPAANQQAQAEPGGVLMRQPKLGICADDVLCCDLCCVVCCRHGPKRAAYLADFWKVVDWSQVSKNFGNAKAGKIQSMVE